MSPSEPAYAGRWVLLPELCFYEEGEPPREGTYTITVEGERARFTVEWLPADGGPARTVAFAGVLDGVPHPSEDAPGAEVAFTAESPAVLVSEVFVDGSSVAFARRQVSADGALLAVLQTAVRPDGTTSRDTQVYRRAT